MNKELSLEAVAPVRPIAPYIGGKRALAGRLVQLIESIPHDVYAEPFVGMGGVFFRRRRRPKKEVINDISADIVNLFRLLQRHYQQLLDVLKWQICSRAEFERLPYAELITRYDRSATLFYLDPPYHGNEDDYGDGVFSAADFHRLRTLLEGIQGRFVMSINDTPSIRQIFAGMAMEEVALNYRVSGGVTPARELIISGP